MKAKRVHVTLTKGRRPRPEPSGLERAKEFLDDFEDEALDGRAVVAEELSPQAQRAVEFFEREQKEVDRW